MVKAESRCYSVLRPASGRHYLAYVLRNEALAHSWYSSGLMAPLWIYSMLLLKVMFIRPSKYSRQRIPVIIHSFPAGGLNCTHWYIGSLLNHLSRASELLAMTGPQRSRKAATCASVRSRYEGEFGKLPLFLHRHISVFLHSWDCGHY